MCRIFFLLTGVICESSKPFCSLTLCFRIKFIADIEIFFSFPRKYVLTFHTNCLETICMKKKDHVFWKNEENIINLSSDEIAQRVVKFNQSIHQNFELKYNTRQKNENI